MQAKWLVGALAHSPVASCVFVYACMLTHLHQQARKCAHEQEAAKSQQLWPSNKLRVQLVNVCCSPLRVNTYYKNSCTQCSSEVPMRLTSGWAEACHTRMRWFLHNSHSPACAQSLRSNTALSACQTRGLAHSHLSSCTGQHNSDAGNNSMPGCVLLCRAPSNTLNWTKYWRVPPTVPVPNHTQQQPR